MKITAGPFGGHLGLYQGQSTRDRERILLNILGSQRPVLIASNLIVPRKWRGCHEREELVALRDAIDLTLALPDSIREQVARWLTPEAAKPNGRDPTPLCSRWARVQPRRGATSRSMRKPPSGGSSRQCRRTPGSSVVELARAAGSGRSVAGERFANWRSAE